MLSGRADPDGARNLWKGESSAGESALERGSSPTSRRASLYKGIYREAGGRGSGGVGIRLRKTPLPYQDHVDFSGAVDAGNYLVLDIGGAAGAGYQVHIAA